MRIKVILRSKDKLNKYELESEVLVRNITENSFFMLRFYESHEDIFVYLSASIVLNGLIP